MLVRMRFYAYQDGKKENVIFDLKIFLKRGSNNVKRKNNEKLNKEKQKIKIKDKNVPLGLRE